MKPNGDAGLLKQALNMSRRTFLKTSSAAGATAMVGLDSRAAKSFAYEPYYTDDELTTVVTSCAHNCGSRHMLVAHKKGDVIVRLSSDDGSYQGDPYGTDTFEKPQVRACLRGRSYRARIYSPERLLYPMMRVGERGEGKFRRVSWDEALDFIVQRIQYIKATYGPSAILDQSYAGSSWAVLHKSDQIQGLLGRFLGIFGSRTVSWSVPSYQATAFSSKTTYGTIQDGNEDDTYAYSKLIIMWGWNPAYTFHGGNTFYYMRLAKQQGCKFVLVDPQYTDSASTYDAWWIPIRPNTDAAMMAGMAHYIYWHNLQDQDFINKFCLGADPGTMPVWARNQESFRDYVLGTFDNQPKTPEWAEQICGVSAEDIKKLAHMYATTKPAALKACWAPGRAAYGEQYCRMANALQAITGNIGVAGGCAEGIGKAWHAESVAGPQDQFSNVFAAAIKSDAWAHCVLNYPNVRREEIGLWPKPGTPFDGMIPNIRAMWWQGSNWLNQLPNVNRAIEAIKQLDLVICQDSTITPSALYADVVLPVATHFERHDVALPWYKGHYYIHRPKVIAPLGESKTDLQIFTELAFRLGFGQVFNPKAGRDYFDNDDAVDEAYLREWWENKVMVRQDVSMSWDQFKRHGVYKFKLTKPLVAFQENIEQGKPFQTPSGKIEIFSTTLATTPDFTKTEYGYPIPAIPRWIEPWEWHKSEKVQEYPFQMVTPHPRWRTHTIFHNIGWLKETYQQEITLNASDAERLDIKTGDVVYVWNERGAVVCPAYVTERCMPGVVVLYEGSWMDLDERGVDRSGNPDFMTLDWPTPAGGFCFNTLLVNLQKTELAHRPGWDQLAISRSHVFRRET
jgi:anaerobic dimethyl sulfoxide reductase subunit A